MGKNMKEELKLNVKNLNIKEAKRLSREEEIASGVHRGNAAGPMPDKKKEENKSKARKKIDQEDYR